MKSPRYNPEKKSNAKLDWPLLKTKLLIPSLTSHFLPRSRLIQSLKTGLKCRLTLLSAPPGFGKTSLLAEWVSGVKLPVGWYSIDSGDNNPEIFLRYLISALQSITPDIGRAALSQLQSPQSSPFQSILTGLVNDIALSSEEFILVLDDYHLIDNPSIHEMIRFLLEHQPENMHFVIATRSDPPFLLSRLRSCHQLTEVRASDLSFTKKETSSLMNDKLKLGLSNDDIVLIDEKVEGWIAGLQLLALSVQGRTDISEFIKNFQASDRYIADYLMEEVLNRQSQKTQNFLLQTSILEQLTGPLCDVVTGQDDGQKMLNNLDKSNLFIFPLDKERIWFRYHPLFSDLLRQRLMAANPDHSRRLHNRASLWLEKDGQKEEGLKHALAGKDFNRAVKLIEDVIENVWDRGQQTKFLEWLSILPKNDWMSKPQFLIYSARAHIFCGQLDKGEQDLQGADKAIQNMAIPVRQKELNGKLATISAILAAYRGDVQSNIRHSRKAVEFLDKKDLMWRSVAATTLGMAYGWSGIGDMMAARQAFSEARSVSKKAGNTYYEVFAELCLASVDGLQGRFENAISIFRRLIEDAESKGLGSTSQTGTIYGSLGNIIFERGRFEEGMELIKKGLSISVKGHDVVAISSNRLVFAYALFYREDFTEVKKIIQQIEKDMSRFSIPRWMGHVVNALKARVWQISGKEEKVVRWIKEFELTPEDDIVYRREIEYSILVRHLIGHGHYESADTLLSKLIHNAESDTRIVNVVQWRLLKVINIYSQGNLAQAAEELRKALYLAEPGGFIRTIIGEGPPILELLDKIYEEEIAAQKVSHISIPVPYLKRLRLAYKNRASLQKGENRDKLSEREMEVLHFISDGYTNKEIADTLFISLNTVRTHTKNINSKLQVHNRTMAVKRAKEMGLI